MLTWLLVWWFWTDEGLVPRVRYQPPVGHVSTQPIVGGRLRYEPEP